MRIKIILGKEHKWYSLPWGYPYYISASIYSLLKEEDPEFSNKLHSEGFRQGYKRFKFFTFSPLLSREFQFTENFCRMLAPMSFFLSSPLDQFIDKLCSAMEKQGKFTICGFHIPVLKWKKIPLPEFKEKMKFRTLSPVTVSKMLRKKYPEYLTPSVPEFFERLRRNLLVKYAVFSCSTEKQMRDFNIHFEVEDFQTKLIRIKKTCIKGVLMRFKVYGIPNIMKFGYEAGFGEKTSVGFGSVEVITEKNY